MKVAIFTMDIQFLIVIFEEVAKHSVNTPRF